MRKPRFSRKPAKTYENHSVCSVSGLTAIGFRLNIQLRIRNLRYFKILCAIKLNIKAKTRFSFFQDI